ncbi:MAG: hypothetical protein LBH92_08725 [Bacteroidales bacterium]|jgi:hypothetical protein|nr:hypothetical protein [Bacteroidales bacterium]
MKKVLVILFFALFYWGAAQQIGVSSPELPSNEAVSTGRIAKFINEHYESEEDKIKAIYSWIGEHIIYDVEKAMANSTSIEKKQRDKEADILNTLQRRKGVCQDYSELMEMLCGKCGIRAYMVGGFVLRKGQENEEPHAWIVALIDDEWKIYDPTWGAGYVHDGVFTRRLSYDFYDITPSKSITDRMPFDPMWQLLNHPVSIPDFYSGIFIRDTTKPSFNYRDTIVLYELQDKITQYRSVLRRIENGGVYNQATVDQAFFIKNEIENDKIEKYNQAVANYNEAINYLNRYAHYFNAKFTPEKERSEAENIVSTAKENIEMSITQLQSIDDPSSMMQKEIDKLIKAMNDMIEKVRSGEEFIKQYYDTEVTKRQELFYIRVSP